jgi:hypothetical protein
LISLESSPRAAEPALSFIFSNARLPVWSVIDTWEDMDGPDASMMLEHLADWK